MEQVIDTGGNTENKVDYAFPQLAGFWRRIAAFLIDALLLGILGQIIGWSASSFWFTIGPYGRFLGLFIVLVYFTLLYSWISNGQTLGKRLLGIAVRDKNNKPVSIKRSLLRISILAFPSILNGWELPIFNNNILSWLIGIIVFGGIAVIVYTMLFNRGSKQGIHDLICGTYVVRLKGEGAADFPVAAKKHWIVSGILISITIVIVTIISFFSGNIISKAGLSDGLAIQKLLIDDGRFHNASIQYNTTRIIAGNITSVGSSTSYITVEAWYKGKMSESERVKAMNDIADIVMEKTDNIDEFDKIRVVVKSAFDLGIGSGHMTYSETKSIDEWK